MLRTINIPNLSHWTLMNKVVAVYICCYDDMYRGLYMLCSHPGDFKTLAEQACQAGEEFCSLYYETYDTRRHVVSKLYTDSSVLIWNGNAVNGTEKITEFFGNLPSSEHVINSLDCQPVHSSATPGQTTILVVVEGQVAFGENELEYFNQNFMLTERDRKWRIASDCFRFIDR